LLAPITVLLGVFFLLPFAIMLAFSFLEPGLYGGVEWNFYPYNYGRILGAPIGGGEQFDPVYLGIFLNSVKLAATTVALSLLVCYPAAFWISRMQARHKTMVVFLVTLPFFSNLLIRVYAWLMLLKPTGFINSALMALGLIDHPLNMIFTDVAVVIGMVYILVPFMFLPLFASVERLDPALIQASHDLGATPFQTFRRVVLPLTLPGIVAGSIIVFIPALGNFIVPSFLGGSKVVMTGNLIERQFLQARNWPFGAALSMLIMAAVLILIVVYVTRIVRSNARSENLAGTP